MIARKSGIVTQLTGGIRGLFKKNKVTCSTATAPSSGQAPTRLAGKGR